MDTVTVVATTADLVGSGTTNETGGHYVMTPEELSVLVAMLSLFSVTGAIGNAIAFYVFSTLKKQKLTSTIFILALAGTDFLTCLITMPFTIAIEILDFEIQVDFFCKFYHFLITTTVPFSAFVMVVIAVDRYLCICHPFLHWMTQRKAKIIIGCLALFIFCIGGIICAQYSIYTVKYVPAKELYNITGSPDSGSITVNISEGLSGGNFSFELDTLDMLTDKGVEKHYERDAVKVVYAQQCDRREDTIDKDFFAALQRIYSGFFLVSCVAVLILYSLIYHSVVAQRRKKFKIRSANCCFLWESSGVANGEPTSEVTAALELSHVNGEHTKIRPDEFTTTAGGGEEGTATNGSSRAPLSRTRLERMRMANIKTALMLFVVTIVFIIAFLPSWLIALKIIRAPVLVFYMYFIYNVVNPFIYAFMNQNFRTELKKMFSCKQ